MIDEMDRALIEQAVEIIRKRYKEDHHHIGAALRTTSGNVYCAVHVEAYIGRITLCAEAVAIGMAASAGDLPIDTIVAVGVDGKVVPPCGMCRELIADYGHQAQVIVPGQNEIEKVSINFLLPNKYTR
ncbi:MAG TPA: cytidine deaminase [Anaerolineaceae bacterium]|nr:cytidine deaminase [Anaerolineaceae bacterium]